MKDIWKKIWSVLTDWMKKKTKIDIPMPDDKPDEDKSFPESVPNNGADVSVWPQSCTLGKVIWQSPGITWTYSDEGDRDAWPEFSGDLNGHLCALIKGSDGNWHQCYLDSLRRKGRNGWNSQTLAPFQKHGNLIKPPLNGWKAKRGEKIGIYVVPTGWVYRDTGHRGRSNVVWTEYPY